MASMLLHAPVCGCSCPKRKSSGQNNNKKGIDFAFLVQFQLANVQKKKQEKKENFSSSSAMALDKVRRSGEISDITECPSQLIVSIGKH